MLTDYDLAGFAVGAVDRARMLDPETVRPGDVIFGLASTGVHSNGYSLVRRVLGVDGLVPGTPEAEECRGKLEAFDENLGESMADAVMKPNTYLCEAYSSGSCSRNSDKGSCSYYRWRHFGKNLDRALPDTVDAIVDSYD